MSDRWHRAMEAASAILPPESWRATLAHALWDTGEVALAGVFTCAPRHLLGAEAAHAPMEYSELAQRSFVERFLPRLERGGYGSGLANAIRGEVYAPFETSPRDEALVARVSRELLAPVGARGMLNVFLLDNASEVIGWISLLTFGDSRDALQECGGKLGTVARYAEATLRHAVDLAAACGAKRPTPAPFSLSLLSARELEVVDLIAQGLSDLNIAERLHISEDTVGSHLRRIFLKLGVHTRVELATQITPKGGSR